VISRIFKEKNAVLTAERRQYILETLQRDGKVLATELSGALSVSEDTIRRDLRELADAGLLQRVHGGALPPSPAVASYAARQQQAPLAKAAIAQAAVQLVRPGQTIILDGGTTTLQVAQRLPPHLRATIITNSPPIAVALAEHPGVEVILLGGRLYKHSLVTTGAATVEALQQMRADLCMLGICSLDLEAGISTPDYEEAQVKRAMIASAAEVAALASAEKLGTAVPYIVGPITELSYLVTERAIPDETLAPYRARGITVIRGCGVVSQLPALGFAWLFAYPADGAASWIPSWRRPLAPSKPRAHASRRYARFLSPCLP
jgi:DeoR/GlpR family transcriptional regulator of sugar metabolism